MVCLLAWAEGFIGECAAFPMGPMMTKWTPGVRGA